MKRATTKGATEKATKSVTKRATSKAGNEKANERGDDEKGDEKGDDAGALPPFCAPTVVIIVVVSGEVVLSSRRRPSTDEGRAEGREGRDVKEGGRQTAPPSSPLPSERPPLRGAVDTPPSSLLLMMGSGGWRRDGRETGCVAQSVGGPTYPPFPP